MFGQSGRLGFIPARVATLSLLSATVANAAPVEVSFAGSVASTRRTHIVSDVGGSKAVSFVHAFGPEARLVTLSDAPMILATAAEIEVGVSRLPAATASLKAGGLDVSNEPGTLRLELSNQSTLERNVADGQSGSLRSGLRSPNLQSSPQDGAFHSTPIQLVPVSAAATVGSALLGVMILRDVRRRRRF